MRRREVNNIKGHFMKSSNLLRVPFSIPRRLRIRLKKIQRDLLWGHHLEEKEMLLVSWGIVCKDRKYGGLGSKKLKALN